MAPFEALYGQIYIAPLYWFELSTGMICETKNKVKKKD